MLFNSERALELSVVVIQKTERTPKCFKIILKHLGVLSVFCITVLQVYVGSITWSSMTADEQIC